EDLAGQMESMMDGMSQMGESMGEGMGESGEGKGSEGNSEPNGESDEQSHDEFQEGRNSNERNVDSLFSNPDSELLQELNQTEEMIGSKFSEEDEDGNKTAKDMSDFMPDSFEQQDMERNPAHAAQLETLEEIKRQQQSKIESMYREMSGLDGEALRIYIDHMEGMKDFINDLTDFFVEKFDLDKEYLYERNQRRGARLQRGYTKNILGTKNGRPAINPRSFERKRPPEKPQFAWSLIIDNSGSCGGEIIEQEKRLAVALIEVSKRLDIPLEIVTFGGSDQFTFLKSFDQDLMGADLQKTVLLNANQGTPDVVTLDAACTSMEKYADQFNRSYNFVYFMTDGQSGEGSIQEVIRRHKREMVITGIGLDSAAQTISQTWGNNAIAVTFEYASAGSAGPMAAGISTKASVSSLTPPPPPPAPTAESAIDTPSELLAYNEPNPIRDVHTTTFKVKGAVPIDAIRVEIFDLSGRLVFTDEQPGDQLDWHTDNNYGEYLANGVYLYRVSAKVSGQWAVMQVKKL
ncbi:MAG: T9SS type A sorting domain-containing protein, partial [Bacteroidota bacterium]|nr:T9SS type A sorting domain-containing protein [Bacteroidota bacterium]